MFVIPLIRKAVKTPVKKPYSYLILFLLIGAALRAPLAFSFGSSASRSQKCTLTLPENLSPKGERGRKFDGYGITTSAAKKDAITACRFEVDIFDPTACTKASNEENEDQNMDCGDAPDLVPEPSPVPAPAPSVSPVPAPVPVPSPEPSPAPMPVPGPSASPNPTG